MDTAVDPGHVCSWSYDRPADVLAGDVVPADLGCDSPARLVCRCGRWCFVRCHSTRESRCGSCAAFYRGRVGLVAGSGLRVSTRGLFVTLTAPGGSQHRMPSGRVCPCTPVDGVDLARWNASAAGRWNRLCQDLRRYLGSDVEYFRGVEVQRRGALHFHLILRRRHGGPLSLSVHRLRRLALKHGFGHSVDVQALTDHHAGYVAKYVSKAADGRPDVPWRGSRWVGGTWVVVNHDTGEVEHRSKPRRRVPSWAPTYRTWSASRHYGDPMRVVRQAQAHYRAVLDVLPAWDGRAGGLDAGYSDGAPGRPDVPPGHGNGPGGRGSDPGPFSDPF